MLPHEKSWFILKYAHTQMELKKLKMLSIITS